MWAERSSLIAEYPPYPQQIPIHSLHDVLGPVAVQVIGKGVCAIQSGLHIQATNEVLWVHLIQVKGYTSHINLLGRLTGVGKLVPSTLYQDKTVVGTLPRTSSRFPNVLPPTHVETHLSGWGLPFLPLLENHEHCIICQGLEILFCLYSCTIFLQHQKEGLVCQHQGVPDLENKVSEASAIPMQPQSMRKTHIASSQLPGKEQVITIYGKWDWNPGSCYGITIQRFYIMVFLGAWIHGYVLEQCCSVKI